MDVEQFLSQQHMLTPEQVADLETNGQLPLIEEFHGTYGLQVIRAVRQSRTWGNDIKLHDKSNDNEVNAYALGKNNIPTCVISTGIDSGDKPYFSYKCIEAFKERGDTHHTISNKMSSLMKNVRRRNAVKGTEIIYPIGTKLIAQKFNNATNTKTGFVSAYESKDISGSQYHSLLKMYNAVSNGTSTNTVNHNSVIEDLEEFNTLESQMAQADKLQTEALSKPIYVIGYSSIGESFYEMVYQRDTNGNWNLGREHKPIKEDEEFPVQIEDLPNFSKYGHLLPMWAIRLKDKSNDNDIIIGKYFIKPYWHDEDKYRDHELNIVTWTRGSSYGWGDYDFYIGLFNVEEAK